MRRSFALVALVISVGLAICFAGTDADRDFSGKWLLDTASSKTGNIGSVENSIAVSQSEVGILCSAGEVRWSYALDGSETRKRIGQETRNSVVKWEGAALLVNTIVSGPQNYTVMDRWVLSRDRNTLTISRQVIRLSGETGGTLVYRREGAPVAAAPDMPPPPRARQDAPVTLHPEDPGRLPQAGLAARPQPAWPPDVTVRAGTRVLLSLLNQVSTKRAKEGDRVYLQTATPVAIDGQIVIPRGSDVAGTITRAKPAGKVAGKGELFIRFDSLTLPNGVSRDFHARPPGDEGKVDGDTKAADGRTVMMGTGMGASIGAITRGLPGAAVGGGIGALAGVLLSRNQDVVLPQGTRVEMVLDRDLVFHPDEIGRFR